MYAISRDVRVSRKHPQAYAAEPAMRSSFVICALQKQRLRTLHPEKAKPARHRTRRFPRREADANASSGLH
jgi:hypothetical protein